MKKQLFAIVILNFATFLFSQSVYAQDKAINFKRLTWADFSGLPDQSSTYWAFTYWNVFYEYDAPKFNGDIATIKFRVWNKILPKSWVNMSKIKQGKSEELLKHEQGHFDFSIICALELKKRFRETTFYKSSYKTEIKQIFNEVFEKYKKLQITYDEETQHMKVKSEQKRWNKWFADQIRELRQYN